MPQKTSSYRPTPANKNAPAPTKPAAAIEDLDDFLEEIDGLLETNALEVTRAYIQKGGE